MKAPATYICTLFDIQSGLESCIVESTTSYTFPMQTDGIFYFSVSVSVSARYCIPQCVRLIAGGGGVRVGSGVHDSTHFQCRLMGSFTSPGIDTR